MERCQQEGFEACRAIAAAGDSCGSPRIVALSADAFACNDASLVSCGFADALARPFKVAQIEAVIRESARG